MPDTPRNTTPADTQRDTRPLAQRAVETFCGIVLLALLVMPAALSPWGSSGAKEFVFRTERRPATDWPEIHRGRDVLDNAFWTQAAGALRDRVAFRGAYIEAKNVIDQRIFGRYNFGRVDVGLDGWLYFRPSFGERLESPSAVDAAVDAFEAFRASPARGPARLVFVLAPDKHTIHPEHLRGASRVEIARWADARERLHTRIARIEGPEVIDAWSLYRAERASLERDVYFPLDTHHNRLAHRAMIRAMLERVAPGTYDPADFHEIETVRRAGDLVGLSGLPIDPIEVPALQLRRQSDPPERSPARDPMFGVITQHLASPETARVVPGRTLIVHDSFGQQMRWLFGSYFEDATMVREAAVTADELLAATHAYDTVIIELVERHASERMPRLFDEHWVRGEQREPDGLDAGPDETGLED
ncbi:MAG: hypothetical protein AAFP26_05825 [Planctomycetota bacterium]